MTGEVERIAAIRDPFELLREATARMSAAQEEVTELARLRRRVIQELHDKGMSFADIAQQVGLSRGRIHQIRHAGPAPEGAFLGQGTVTISTPLKQEAIRSRPVVAIEDMTGAQRLGDLARSLGLEPSFESIPIGGEIDLNRPNQVVISGPRISEHIAQVLAQDPVLQFERASDGPWTLVDRTTGTVYRSGQDQTPPRSWDVAYLGRLPRPDRQGSLIVFTGIHPPGSLGVVHLLCTRISELYNEVKTGHFSVLVGTEYDPDTHEPRHVELLTPLYRLEDN
ncbi:sigma-70 family RNA polymerase sigma factor [Micromonospora sp. DR5-3]|uniref:sigma factor-like helix-turn-helix DNA-binding protein n=1 Tax=unclassified Micromonospora TaxID=2617518 RepID=UPI0011D53789|nr:MULTISPECIES: sigma factor-like helix-turn-helix DNA-binding protein [unclassified Micromonospora]MCW3815706.1 sigma-70 family RNA polymerase sigma factor [Micromonospora sp. DR5-3]TYC23860.1 sigma-70 family RNA polymerase sigma factor [Micromonospora sp. MP36]